MSCCPVGKDAYRQGKDAGTTELKIAFDAIIVGVWKCALVTNFFVMLGLRNRVRVSIRVSFRINIKLIHYSAM